jgi:hypothetical protein
MYIEHTTKMSTEPKKKTGQTKLFVVHSRDIRGQCTTAAQCAYFPAEKWTDAAAIHGVTAIPTWINS